jgi:hypothetical protein
MHVIKKKSADPYPIKNWTMEFFEHIFSRSWFWKTYNQIRGAETQGHISKVPSVLSFFLFQAN